MNISFCLKCSVPRFARALTIGPCAKSCCNMAACNQPTGVNTTASRACLALAMLGATTLPPPSWSWSCSQRLPPAQQKRPGHALGFFVPMCRWVRGGDLRQCLPLLAVACAGPRGMMAASVTLLGYRLCWCLGWRPKALLLVVAFALGLPCSCAPPGPVACPLPAVRCPEGARWDLFRAAVSGKRGLHQRE